VKKCTEREFLNTQNFILDVQFTHQQMHLFILKNTLKIYSKIHTNIAPTCFGLRPSTGSLH